MFADRDAGAAVGQKKLDGNINVLKTKKSPPILVVSPQKQC